MRIRIQILTMGMVLGSIILTPGQSSEYTIESFQSEYNELASYQSVGILTGGDPLWEYQFDFEFPFPFYDSLYNSVFYEQNAWGAFTEDQDLAVFLMNSSSSYTYDDIVDTTNITSDVRFSHVGVGLQQAFVIQFTKARFFADPFEDSLDTYFNFQIWFFENGTLEVHFGEAHMDENPIYEAGKGFYHYTSNGGVDTTVIDGPHMAISHPLDEENAIGLSGAYDDYEVVGDLYSVLTVLPPEGWVIRFKPTSVSTEDIPIRYEQLEVCPNPTSAMIRLPHTNGRVHVIDSKGSIVYKGNPAQEALDVSALGPGMYYVQIIEDGKISTGRFVRL